MKKNKIVIWDLFGGSQNSVYNALKYFKKYEVYTFDNNPNIQHDKQYVVDLSNLEEFDKVVQENNIPSPDIIAASPLCQSFSIVLNAGKGERVAITFDNETQRYKVRELEDIQRILESNKFLSQNDAKALQDRAILGMKLVENTLAIIEKYKPSKWYIENPQTSLMWNYIKKNHRKHSFWFENLAHYNSYDLSFTRKATIFYSNHLLHLKHYNIQGNVIKRPGDRLPGSSKNETGERVKIPALLIIDIIESFVGR